jgi:hypothetical protein
MDNTTNKRGEQPMKCSICGKDIPAVGGRADGHNAQPVNDGRCCDECNLTVVIPERMQQAIWVQRKREEKAGES